ncbi:MAG: cation-translocating P-type ATPase [Ardenticatenales bacterium]
MPSANATPARPSSSTIPPVPWHALGADETAARLDVDPALGLAEAEAAHRLDAHGPNTLDDRGRPRAWRILVAQLVGPMTAVLVVAAVASIALGDMADAIAIGAIIVLNTALGFAQEYRAERAMAALKSLAAPVVRVRRAGRVRELPASELAPGDIALLEAGAIVPADGRLLEAADLRVLEAILTGESEPVRKTVAALPPGDRAIGDRTNLVFKGTVVAAGRGTAVVVATGMATELGRIAEMLQAAPEPPTPLQRRLAQLGRGLGVAALVIVAAVGAIGLARGQAPALVLLTALSLAVAAVPEGLPTVVTIALSIGAQRLLARRALVRRLPAVETLGSVTVICSDKTGTLTMNRMQVVILDVAGHRIGLDEARADDDSSRPAGEGDGRGGDDPSLALLLTAAALCNDAVLAPLAPDEAPHALGDPTEGALLVAATRLGPPPAALGALLLRTAEVPFDAERKRMTTVHRVVDAQALPAGVRDALRRPDGGFAPAIAFTKGAVDIVLEHAAQVWAEGRSEPLTAAWRARIAAAHDELAGRGMRVLGIAFRALEDTALEDTALEDTALEDRALEDRALDGKATLAAPSATAEEGLTFVGLAAMIDPPRPAAREAVARCRAAGIRPIMISGDHPLTALQIARQVGILEASADAGPSGAGAEGDEIVLTGVDLDGLSPDGLVQAAATCSVFARVSPEHKLSIVRALHARGQVVAMTGDGVNDAPALKQADIGVAMGITGADVTKEAADMVLLDDDFATIVRAVEQGRVVYDNIRRFVLYALASNAGEVGVMLVGPLLGMPLPLLPLQILWVNLVTDGLPGLALAVEPAEAGVMNRPPRPPDETIFGRGLGRHVLWVGALLAATSLAAGWSAWRVGDPAWRTMVFTTLTISQMGHAMAVRSERRSLFTLGWRSNLALFGAVVLTLSMQLAAVYAAPLRAALDTVPLGAADAMRCIAYGSIVFWAIEAKKAWLRSRAAALR